MTIAVANRAWKLRGDRLMKRRRATLCAFLCAVGFWFCGELSASELFHHRLGNGQDIYLSIQLNPAQDNWTRLGQNSYSGDHYELTFSDRTDGARSEFTIQLRRKNGSSFLLQRFAGAWPVEDPKPYAVWTYNRVSPDGVNYRALASERFEDLTRPNFGIPYALAASREGKNILAIGMLSQNRVMDLVGQPHADGTYWISLSSRLPVRVNLFTETFYTDAVPGNWFDVTRSYARWVDQTLEYTPFPISPACYYPTYDIWYWALDNTNMDLYWQTLFMARELGFRSYIFDAGWESPAGELFKWLNGSLGNYFAPASKLPFFDQLLRRAREMLDMHVVLWMAPYAMGRKSIYYPDLGDAHTLFRASKQSVYHGGEAAAPHTLPLNRRYLENLNLCPRNAETREHLRALFTQVLNQYQPDGFWLDFEELIPFLCDAPHEHSASFGPAFNRSQQQIKTTVLGKIRQPTVEFRYPFANLNNKGYANLWQATDFPEDFDGMRMCSLLMRPFSEGVVMGTDEMYWSPQVDEAEAAKFVTTTIFTGVPAMGADFLRAPHSHARIVKAWLKFYKENREDLTLGDFRPFGDFIRPNQKIESAKKAFVYLRYALESPVEIQGSPQEIYLANCTDSDFISVILQNLSGQDYIADVLDVYLKPISTRTLHLGADENIHESVPQGGLLRLTRVQ